MTALLPAAVGPRAALLILRHAGPDLERWAAQYELTGKGTASQESARQLRLALAQMGACAAQLDPASVAESGSEVATSEPSGAGVAEGSVVSPPSLALLRVREAALILDVSESYVTRLIREGRLPSRRGEGRGRPHLVARCDVESLLEERAQP